MFYEDYYLIAGRFRRCHTSLRWVFLHSPQGGAISMQSLLQEAAESESLSASDCYTERRPTERYGEFVKVNVYGILLF